MHPSGRSYGKSPVPPHPVGFTSHLRSMATLGLASVHFFLALVKTLCYTVCVESEPGHVLRVTHRSAARTEDFIAASVPTTTGVANDLPFFFLRLGKDAYR
jgi:hypothetical protein